MNDMIEVQTADLIGPALDWAVAKAAAIPMFEMGLAGNWPGNNHVTQATQIEPAVIRDLTGRLWYEASLRSVSWSPSTDLSQGGPLIDKYNPQENSVLSGGRYAEVWLEIEGGDATMGRGLGETRLIAACRAIVGAKLGETVQVPAELLQ